MVPPPAPGLPSVTVSEQSDNLPSLNKTSTGLLQHGPFKMFRRISTALGDKSSHDNPDVSQRTAEPSGQPNAPDSLPACEDSESDAGAGGIFGAQSGGPPGVSLWRSAQDRSAELAKYFGLPPSEAFLDDYNCALRKRILLQGRMYIFDHYVCFSSFVFGFARKVVIPLSDVYEVRKKTHLRFPNSIKIEMYNHQDGKDVQYFFTSFLSREDAYQLITNCVAQSQAQSSLEHDFSLAAHAHLAAGITTASMPPVLRQPNGNASPDAPPVSHSRETHSLPVAGRGLPRPRMTMEDDDEDEECEGEGEAAGDCVWGVVTTGPVPKAHKDATVLIRAVLDGTPKDLFEVLWADSSHLLEDFYEAQGCRRIHLKSWRTDDQLGHVRDMQFIQPIKGAFSSWGVATTQCHQSHRFRQFAGGHLVFESNQTMTDIPYGDCFSVDLRWDVHPLPVVASTPMADENGGLDMCAVPQLQVTISVRVPFNCMCLFKKVIESGVMKQVRENHTLFITELRAALTQMQRDRQPLQLGSPTMAQRLTSALPSMGRGHAPPPLDAPSCQLSRAGSGQNLSTRAAAPAGPGGWGTPMGGADNCNGSAAWRPWNNNTKSAVFSARSAGYSMLRKFSMTLPRKRDVSAFMSDAGGVVAEQFQQNQQMFYFLLAILVLGIQLVVLYFTLRGYRAAPKAHGHGHGWRQDTSGGSMEALVTLGREVWARRAAILDQELSLLRQQMQLVEEQLKAAQAHANGA